MSYFSEIIPVMIVTNSKVWSPRSIVIYCDYVIRIKTIFDNQYFMSFLHQYEN